MCAFNYVRRIFHRKGAKARWDRKEEWRTRKRLHQIIMVYRIDLCANSTPSCLRGAKEQMSDIRFKTRKSGNTLGGSRQALLIVYLQIP